VMISSGSNLGHRHSQVWTDFINDTALAVCAHIPDAITRCSHTKRDGSDE